MKFNPEIRGVGNQEKPLNALKNEHLKEGVEPIVGGVYDRHNLDKDTQYFLDNFKKNAEFVDWDMPLFEAKKKGISKFEEEVYIISDCNDRNKYTINLKECTSIVVSAIDKKTGKKISFMSHQNPQGLFENNFELEKFKKDLLESFDEIIFNSEPKTIDVVILGGENNIDLQGSSPKDKKLQQQVDENYIRMIKFLDSIVSSKVGFSPVVMSGPNDNYKSSDHSMSAYFDNDNRNVYMLRPKQDLSIKNESFIASNVEDQIKEIHKKENEK